MLFFEFSLLCLLIFVLSLLFGPSFTNICINRGIIVVVESQRIQPVLGSLLLDLARLEAKKLRLRGRSREAEFGYSRRREAFGLINRGSSN